MFKHISKNLWTSFRQGGVMVIHQSLLADVMGFNLGSANVVIGKLGSYLLDAKLLHLMQVHCSVCFLLTPHILLC